MRAMAKPAYIRNRQHAIEAIAIEALVKNEQGCDNAYANGCLLRARNRM